MSKLSKVIDKWYSSAKRILFKYRDGFFELPIMSNSPETVVKSLTKMPFVYHDAEKEIFGSKNPFLNADVFYHKVKEGLWYNYSKAEYKENVNYIRVNNKEIASDYYLLFLEINENKGNSKNALLNGVFYSNSSWVLTKPQVSSTHCRFKGSKTISMALFFNDEWLSKQLYKQDFFSRSLLKKFFNSEAKLAICPEGIEFAEEIEKQFNIIFTKKTTDQKVQQLEWRAFTFKFIQAFVAKYEEGNIADNLLEIAHVDRKKIQKTEKILLDHLQGDFMGIEDLATEVGLSPTKLKNNFRLVFGDSIFQFFRKKQLESAKVLLQQTDQSIKEIAAFYGYKNPSKFTAAYKETFGILPSDERV